MAKGQGKNGTSNSETVRNRPMAVADEDAAVHFVETLRWGADKAHGCPRCDSGDTYVVKDRKTGERNRDYRWRCRGCGKYHTVRTGTVMEDSRIPLGHWCYAFWKCCSSRKGISAKQIERETGLSYKSALFLMHRVRFALADMTNCKLTGTVEADETYVGGKPRHRLPRSKALRGDKRSNDQTMRERKTAVFRSGSARRCRSC